MISIWRLLPWSVSWLRDKRSAGGEGTGRAKVEYSVDYRHDGTVWARQEVPKELDFENRSGIFGMGGPKDGPACQGLRRTICQTAG